MYEEPATQREEMERTIGEPMERSEKRTTWTNEMKLKVIKMDEEERKRGWGFMTRVKHRWECEYPQHKEITAQCLRDNARRFRKDETIMKLEGGDQEADENEETSNEHHGNTATNGESGDIREVTDAPCGSLDELEPEYESIPETGLCEDGVRIMTEIFKTELGRLERITVSEMKPRETLRKVQVKATMLVNANEVLKRHLAEKKDGISGITDATYAMAKTIEQMLGVKGQSRKTYHENGRIRKLRRRIKELRQMIAMISNEIWRRRNWRKSTAKEKSQLRALQKETGDELRTEEDMIVVKERWIDKRRMTEVKLKKALRKDKRIKNNKTFKTEEGRLCRELDTNSETEGTIPDIGKFVEFWGNIWENDSRTPSKEWMMKVKQQISEKVSWVEELNVTEGNFKEVIRKRKNWSAPGVDGIPNFWWKNLKATWQPLCVVMQEWIDNNDTIPDWIALGRTVLIPKTKNLSSEKDYRPITCLNTSYKIFTGILAKYLKKHADENDIWDRSQMGTCEKVLGTVDQLLIDNCIMDEVRTYHRDLAVAYYDYQKAYDMVHHDWILRVLEWMKVPDKIRKVIRNIMSRWKTRLEVRRDGNKDISRWIRIKRGFLQGDSFSPVGFCLTEVPISMLIQESEGYRMGPPGDRNLRRTHSLFIDDLKIYQQNHAKLQLVNDTIVQASLDTGACYGVKKCAEAVFKRGRMIHGEGLAIGEDEMKALNPQREEIYKFLGCEQGEGTEIEVVRERLRNVVKKRTEKLVELELYDKNLMKAINCRVIPVAGYLMNVCKFSQRIFEQLDKIVKKVLRDKGMHGRLTSDERLYLPCSMGGRGLKSFRDVYRETKVRVASYMVCSGSEWINTAWQREVRKEGTSLKCEAERAMSEVGVQVTFGEGQVQVEGTELPLDVGYRPVWDHMRCSLKEKALETRVTAYKKKCMQSETYQHMEERDHQWLKCNNDPRKVASIIGMQEKMVETAGWKASRGLPMESDRCRLCKAHKETVYHWLSGCKKLAGSEYIKRHDNALKILCVEWCKREGLMEEGVPWYKVEWKRGYVSEANGKKFLWDFEYAMRTTSSARRPDATLEYEDQILIYR